MTLHGITKEDFENNREDIQLLIAQSLETTPENVNMGNVKIHPDGSISVTVQIPSNVKVPENVAKLATSELQKLPQMENIQVKTSKL